MPRLFLHIGAMKTGTTAIQNYLAQDMHADRLQVLPVALHKGAHHRIAATLMGAERPGRAARRNLDIGELTRAIAACRRTATADSIASSEILSTVDFLAAGGPEKLRALFEGWDVRIVLYVRNQIDWIESAYREECKKGAFLGDFDSWCDRVKERGIASFVRMVETYRTHFGDRSVEVVGYDDHRDDIMAPLERITGVAVDRSRLKDANVSGSLRAIFALQSIARDIGRDLRGPRSSNLVWTAVNMLPDDQKYTLVSPGRAERIAADYKAENDRLRDLTGIDLNPHMRPKTAKLFDPSRTNVGADKSLLIAALAGRVWSEHRGMKGKPPGGPDGPRAGLRRRRRQARQADHA